MVLIYSSLCKDGEKFTYTGKIHTLDEEAADIIDSESCFRIGKNVVKRSLNEEKKLEFEFTIKNLNEEAKDDKKSVLSDGE